MVNEIESSSSQLPPANTEFSAEELRIITELKNMLVKKTNPIAYDGFQPSEKMSVAQICQTLHLVMISLDSLMANSTPAVDSTSSANSTPAADAADSDPAADSRVKFIYNDTEDVVEPSSQSQLAKSELSAEEKYQLVRSIGEECIQEDELRNLLRNKPNPIAYDGFEPSGRIHIAQGIMKVINVNKLVDAGFTVKIWIADWFAKLNNKMSGDMRKIHTVGKYFIEVWKASGMHLENVQFLWSSEEICKNTYEYFPLMLDIANAKTIARLKRCGQIMGRDNRDELSDEKCEMCGQIMGHNKSDELPGGQILYPCMQCADIFFLKADVCQLGMDQRKVNVLAREYCSTIKRKNKPIILSHHMLPGLQKGQEKMSKSDPSSSIYMEDGEDEVNRKIKKAYCPEKVVEGNPCLEYIQYIVFPWFKKFEVVRKPENGGNKEYNSFEALAEDYASNALHPNDLKPALAKAINEILQPVRNHFETDSVAKGLLKAVKSYKVTK